MDTSTASTTTADSANPVTLRMGKCQKIPPPWTRSESKKKTPMYVWDKENTPEFLMDVAGHQLPRWAKTTDLFITELNNKIKAIQEILGAVECDSFVIAGSYSTFLV